MTCKELIDALGEYLDAALGPEAVEELTRHLEQCPPCVAYLATYRKTREVARAAGRVEMPDEMKRLLRDFLRDKLTGAQE